MEESGIAFALRRRRIMDCRRRGTASLVPPLPVGCAKLVIAAVPVAKLEDVASVVPFVTVGLPVIFDIPILTEVVRISESFPL
jgi:hypothetical protein